MWADIGIGAAAGVTEATIKACKGNISSIWKFMKEAFKIAVKSSFLGGAAGAGLGVLSGSLYEVGSQGDKSLSKANEGE